MPSQYHQQSDGLAILQIRLLRFSYSTAIHGTRSPWEHANTEVDYLLTLKELPVDTGNENSENQVFLVIMGGQVQLDYVNLVELARLSRIPLSSSHLTPGYMERQGQYIDRRIQVWIHNEQDLSQLLEVLQHLRLPISYVDNRAAILGGNASLASLTPSTNVNPTVGRISLPSRPPSTTLVSTTYVPSHSTITTTSSSSLNPPARPQSLSSEIHRPNSTSTLSAFGRSAVATSGFSSSPVPYAIPQLPSRFEAQRPASALAIMSRNQGLSPTYQRVNEISQNSASFHPNTSSAYPQYPRNNPLNPDISNIYLSQMQKNPLRHESPAILGSGASQNSQVQPQNSNRLSPAISSGHTPLSVVSDLFPKPELSNATAAPFLNAQPSSPQLPLHSLATSPTKKNHDNKLDKQNDWIPPRRELPFPKLKEKKNPPINRLPHTSPLPESTIKTPIPAVAAAVQPAILPPPKPVQRQPKRVAQRKAAPKSSPATVPPSIPIRSSSVILPCHRKEVASSVSRIEATQLDTSSKLQSKAAIPTKQTTQINQPYDPLRKVASSFSSSNIDLISEAVPLSKRLVVDSSSHNPPAAKRVRTIEQGTQTVKGVTAVSEQEPFQDSDLQVKHLNDIYSAFVKYKSRPAPAEIHDAPGYSEMSIDAREKLLQNWFHENLQDEEFLSLLEDMENSWLRIGLEN
ncbi:hypothetical protein PVAG01_05941 [Phlyctema vagabunda]|uniref:Uncharacterized protein n=1 Tax=Phlyctema vagabunda TaxID=108571 RepID=A0ABR4PEN6_9HELO